jgi:predicted dehydrogenase
MVGMGERGISLLPTLLALPDLVINAVCDIDPHQAEQAQKIVEKKTGAKPKSYVKGERDWENLVARDDLIASSTPRRGNGTSRFRSPA